MRLNKKQVYLQRSMRLLLSKVLPIFTSIAIVSIGVCGIEKKEKSATEMANLELRKKLETYSNVSSINFHNQPLKSVLGYLQLLSKELDPGGVGIKISLDSKVSPALAAKKISIDFKDVPLSEVLLQTANLGGGSLSMDGHVISLVPGGSAKIDKGDTKAIKAKLDSIVLPALKFPDVPADDLIKFVQLRARELDKMTTESGGRSVNIVLDVGSESSKNIAVDLKEVSLFEVLEEITKKAGWKFEINEHLVVITD